MKWPPLPLSLSTYLAHCCGHSPLRASCTLAGSLISMAFPISQALDKVGSADFVPSGIRFQRNLASMSSFSVK